MKLRPKTLSISFLMVMILLGGCAGCAQKNALKGIEPTDDHNEQSKYGPVAANTRKQAKLKPFLEPSIENLIEQFKADVAANRGDPEVLARKRQAIAAPNLFWKPGFTIPKKVIDVESGGTGLDFFQPDTIMILPLREKGKPVEMSFDSPNSPKHKYPGKVYYLTEDQHNRIFALQNVLFGDEKKRKEYEIMFEGINTFSAAKYLSMQNPNIKYNLGREYAERAMQEHPNSVEAMHIWVKCHPKEQIIGAYKELLAKFPNYAEGHKRIARIYLYSSEAGPSEPELVIPHLQKAMQLDSRIDGQMLGFCYYKLGEWEKTIVTYQNMSEIPFRSDPFLYGAQEFYTEERTKERSDR